MKGQTEAATMVILLLIAVTLLFSTFLWGSSVIGGNSDEANLFASEQFMRDLDKKIQNVAKNGGIETLQIKPSASIRMIENNIIEYSFQGKADLPEEWVFIAGDNTAEVGITKPSSVIRERKEGDRIRMQLYYRNRTGASKFLIFPFLYYEGTGRNMIKIENNGTAIFGDLVLNRVKLSV